MECCEKHFKGLEENLGRNSIQLVKSVTEDFMLKYNIDKDKKFDMDIEMAIDDMSLLENDSDVLFGIIDLINDCTEAKMSGEAIVQEIAKYLNDYIIVRNEVVDLMAGKIDPITGERTDENKTDEENYNSHSVEVMTEGE